MKRLIVSALAAMALFAGATSAMAEDVTIYYDNSDSGWDAVGIHYWSNPSTTWPGKAMVQIDDNIWSYTFPADPSGLDGFLFNNGAGTDQTADYKKKPVNGHVYKGTGKKGVVTDCGLYEGNAPLKPVVTAKPESGARFSESIEVTLSVNPAATIYYTLDGTAASTSSTKYNAPITLTETTTISTYAITADGTDYAQEFTYRKRVANPGGNDRKIENDYYRVNPDGKVGSNRTVNAKFTKLNNDNRMCVADNALSNWTEADLICQGVARDIASAIRGKHEYPVIDSYAIYAAYDADNLYIGVQYVYEVWDSAGDGCATNGRAKPYQMDGRLVLAFDLDPELEFDGILTNGNTIWDADGKYNVFANGTDCILMCSTKSTSGVPGLFFPTADGHASYDAAYCKSIPAPFYGCADGLLPSIDHIWGAKSYGYDPEDLLDNEFYTDLIDKCDKSLHTFYEWKLPLATLGVTESYIKSQGIGVMVIDTYGQGAIGSTPYDPTVLDAANTSYSKDKSTSAEKEDMDTFTYAHARIGKLANSGVAASAISNDSDDAVEYYNLQGMRVANPGRGLYLRRQGSTTTKVIL